MAEEDMFLKKWLNSYAGYFFITFVTAILLLKKYGRPWKQHLLARFISAFTDGCNKIVLTQKKELFQALNEMESKDKKLRNEGLIRILEIGAGSGANFQFFPNNCHLIVVEPNTEFKQYFDQNKSKFPHVNLESVHNVFAEDMSDIPDNSVDAVVCTLVLCSVTDAEQVLNEVHRVLAPGGKFLFMEHVWDKKGTTLNKVQRALTASGIWPTLFECWADRNTDILIERHPKFSTVKKQRFYINAPGLIIKVVRSFALGVATK